MNSTDVNFIPPVPAGAGEAEQIAARRARTRKRVTSGRKASRDNGQARRAGRQALQAEIQQARSPQRPAARWPVFVPPDTPPVVWPGTVTLRFAAMSLEDVIKQRVSIGNRLSHTDQIVDAGLAKAMKEAAAETEERFRKLLRDAYELYVPYEVREWAETVPGLGSGALFPRICGITGNPAVAIPYTWPEAGKMPVQDGPPRWRSLRELWQWAGCGDPYNVPYSDVLGHPVTREDKLRAGKRQQLRPILYSWSTSLVRSATPVTRQESPRYGRPTSQAAAESKYWAIFQQAREDARTKIHDPDKPPCKNRKRAPWSNGCATVAHPEWGEPGSPWRPGHQQGHAHRVVQKALLADFWRVAGGY